LKAPFEAPFVLATNHPEFIRGVESGKEEGKIETEKKYKPGSLGTGRTATEMVYCPLRGPLVMYIVSF
jgi:hypothetical protein